MKGKLLLNIIMIIMTTYYMNGCSPSNDYATDYFEARYFAVEKLVDYDNRFQELLENMVSNTPDYEEISEEVYYENLSLLSKQLDSLSAYCKSLLKGELIIERSDLNLDRAFKSLLMSYMMVSSDDYKQLLLVLKKENISEELNNKFNSIYHGASQKLNNQLALFYDASEEYAQDKGIDLEWDKE